MTSQPLNAAMVQDTDSPRKPCMRKLVAIIAGLAASVITGWVLWMPQQIENSQKYRDTFGHLKGDDEAEYTYLWTRVEAGWPWIYYVNNPNVSGVTIDYVALYNNLVICVFLIIGAGAGLGRVIWCASWPPQFSLRSMFNWTVVVATLLGILPVYPLLLPPHREHSPLIAITAGIALALSVFAASWTLMFTAHWLCKVMASAVKRFL